MSNNPFGSGTSPSTFSTTNNPFVLANDPNDPMNRFPKLTDSGQSQNFGQIPQQQPQDYPQMTGYVPQQQFNIYPGQQLGASSYGISAQPTGFQPQSSFGQQLSAATNNTGYPQQQQQPSSNTFHSPLDGAGARFQTSQLGYQNVIDLDPYSNLAQLPWAQPSRPNEIPQSPTATSSSFGGSSWNQDHPRSYVREHKNELEKWDAFAWKQLSQTVVKLRDAWASRKEIVHKAMEGYGQSWSPADAQRVRELLQEADVNIDITVASSFQLKEVESGYRHSSDGASKARVRESLNAALRSLPEWPETLETSSGAQLGMSGGNQQMQQQQQQQPQPPQQFQQQQPSYQQFQQAPPHEQQYGQQQFQPQQHFQPQQPLYSAWNGGGGFGGYGR